MKIWTKLSDERFERQKNFLKDNNAIGIYVLFEMGRWDWLNDDENMKKINGNIIMIGVNAVMNAIKMIKLENYDKDTNEIVKIYYDILNKLG